MLKKIVFAFILLLLGVGSVSAQSAATPGVTKRQKAQKERVKDGVKSGELTRRETANLARDQRRIKRSKRRAKADGSVTRRERARLHSAQNKASRKIRRKKHN